MIGRIREQIQWKRHVQKARYDALAHPLDYLFLELTRRCNFSCQYCGSDCDDTAPRGMELSSERWVKIIEQLAADFRPESVMLAFTGGEPLLKEGVFDIFAAAHRCGFRFGMICNGSQIDSETASKLTALKMHSISLSMDAPPPLNDALRHENASSKVSEAVAHLRAAGYAGVLEVFSTVTKPVVPHLNAMRSHIAALRVPRWRLSAVMPIGRAAHQSHLHIDTTDLRTLLEFIKEARKDGKRPVPELCEEGYLGDRFEGEVRPYLHRCSAGITTGGILADGSIGACPELSRDFIQGHIDERRFSEVWKTEYKSLRDRSWTKAGLCADCDVFDRCQGGALHLYPHLNASFLRCFYRMLMIETAR